MDNNQIFYQIYPLGFCGAPKENDGIRVSRIRKVLDWIPHLQKLGITAVYFGPVFESDRHGYDTRDYRTIDCRLGTNEDFKEVCGALHNAGIKVVLDGVFNHVGRGFFAFEDVKEKKWDSPYTNWFFIDYNNTWGQDGFTYADWEGHNELVKLNLENEEVRSYLLDSVTMWMEEFGIDGIRLDVAYCLNKNFMWALHHHTKNKNPDFFLLGEMIGGDYNTLLNDGMLDSVTNYECRKGLYSSLNSKNLFELCHSLQRQFGSEPWCLYRGKHLLSFADNHDVDRLASVLSDPRDLYPAYALLCAMPGIPCYYYGSEWGAPGMRTKDSDDALRPSFDRPEWNELCEKLKQLNELRVKYPVFTNGDYKHIYLQNMQAVIRRADDHGQMLFAVNIADADAVIHCNFETDHAVDLLTNEEVALSGELHLQPKEVRFFYTSY